MTIYKTTAQSLADLYVEFEPFNTAPGQPREDSRLMAKTLGIRRVR